MQRYILIKYNFFLPTNIPRLQLLLVSIMKSAKNVIKNNFFNNFFFYFTICYIFLQNISKFQEKSFINNYLITNYWFWTKCFTVLSTFQLLFTFVTLRSKTPTYPCIIFYFWLSKVLTSDGSQIRLTCITLC